MSWRQNAATTSAKVTATLKTTTNMVCILWYQKHSQGQNNCLQCFGLASNAGFHAWLWRVCAISSHMSVKCICLCKQLCSGNSQKYGPTRGNRPEVFNFLVVIPSLTHGTDSETDAHCEVIIFRLFGVKHVTNCQADAMYQLPVLQIVNKLQLVSE